MFSKFAIVVAAPAAIGGGVLAVPSYANDNQAHCSVSQNGTTYTGYNEIDYTSYSSSLWELTAAKYNFQPSNSSSTHNNQNLSFWGGSNSWSFNSQDNLVRDAQWHTAETLTSHGVLGQKGYSYMTFTDIFDVPNVSDPSCSASTSDF
jgi:hypothetical protein